MPSIVIVGLQWGDEGKGKVIDRLAEEADHIVRGQGGNNAGHTVVIESEEYKLHLIPSGILYPHTLCYIGGGVVVDPEVLLKEIENLHQRGVDCRGRLLISPYAHVIFPYHLELDRLQSKEAIGTTGKGIGPCYTDKTRRLGIRMAELVRPEILKKKLKESLAVIEREQTLLYRQPPLKFEALFEKYSAFGAQLESYVGGVEEKLNEALKRDDTILLEGAQGTFLDVTFGTYPYVTSSSTTAAGICSGCGFGPSKIDKVIGVAKAYTTRVGLGPLPTALTPEEETAFPDAKEAREFGTTTGRKRRIGWFDAPLTRRGAELSGADGFALMKLDILDGLKEIKVCTGYKLHGKEIASVPALVEDFTLVEPIYERVPGWETPTSDCRKVEELPENARRYVRLIEKLIGVPLYLISTGPKRDQTITIKEKHESACC